MVTQWMGFHVHVPADEDEDGDNGGMTMQGADGVPGVHSPCDELRMQEMACMLQLLIHGCLAMSLFPVYNNHKVTLQSYKFHGWGMGKPLSAP
ncbi:hypothetical protein CONPUDRAFT_153819 [Coniophora puteana RWD-64-598 SS2]|uniref:Uncharacterized protein n=1 Tax=Coniophora puteana (strain RWD-64-598) TaxID=741705 RepID=A0A5M3MQ15_CONPW|nr:uncharacterized protein CONPUDRAFT_153819 [Coniophora puteana RWD-64-598 SS2]EIW81269.1 hypothetical protein CONPUDRAFT_153819 [Coniophora puteana RWD-64-598 SS2]